LNRKVKAAAENQSETVRNVLSSTREQKIEIIRGILKVNYPEKTEHELDVESFIRLSLREKGKTLDKKK
jgi:hypothetical protein